MKRATPGIFLGLKGLAMGIAEVIPGVSGGTIAFITGIYERLLNAIRSMDLELLKLLARLQFREAFRHVDGGFLLVLVVGMAAGLIGGIFGVTHILETHPEVLWGFFFGLILASVWFIGKDVDRRSVVNFLVFLAGTVLALVITWMYPLTASRSLPYVFLCGMVAICALILPGISGSFILLLLGMYTVVIPTVKDLILHQRMEDFLLVAVFAAGCLVGLLSFSRVMSWLFRYYQMPTLALLTGFMLGSLPRIWPWRNPMLWVDDAGQITTVFPVAAKDPHVLREALVLPSGYQGTSNVAWVVLAFAFGIAIVLMLSRIPERGVKLSGQDLKQ